MRHPRSPRPAVVVAAALALAVPGAAEAQSPPPPPPGQPTAAPPPVAPAPAPAAPPGWSAPPPGGPQQGVGPAPPGHGGAPGYGPGDGGGYGPSHQGSMGPRLVGASGYDLSGRYPEFPPGYAPRKIPSDGGVPPPGYEIGSEPRSGLWITGAALLGGIYGATLLAAGTAVSEGEEDLAPLFVPVVGPWVAVRTSDDGEDLRVPLIMSGLGQLAGAGLLVGGLVAQREVFVRSDRAPAAATSAPRASVAVGPGSVSMLGQF